MYPRWLWQGFALPGHRLADHPLHRAVLRRDRGGVRLGQPDPAHADPGLEPADWNVGWVSDALTRLQPGHDLWVVFVRTCEYVGFSLALCLLIGYPVAYYIARHASRTKSLLLILLILPFWISYLMRMLAWVNLLAPDGYVNRFLQFTHVINSPYGFLDGHSSTVVLALVYGYIPYLILPLYAALDRIDKSFMEAARDLGASPLADVPARDPAAVEDRHPGRKRADRAADVRRLLHAEHRLRRAHHVDARKPDRPLLPQHVAADDRRGADAAPLGRSW